MDAAAPEPTEPPTNGSSRTARRVGLALLALAALLSVYAVFVEPRWLDVTHHVARPAADDVAPTLTVVHLSDLHVTRFGEHERRVLALVDEVDPDLVVITGDCVTDGAFDADAVRRFHAALVAQRPRLGVFACPGNHEDWTGPPALEALRASGVEVLEDRVVRLEDGRLALHGLAGPRGAGVAGQPTDAVDVVLCHYPAVLPRVAAPGLELVLAGHTHGGQVRLPLVGALVLPFESGPYDAGWFSHGSTRLFVSRGVGTSILPVRFACRPEVAVHRIALSPDAGDAGPGAR